MALKIRAAKEKKGQAAPVAGGGEHASVAPAVCAGSLVTTRATRRSAQVRRPAAQPRRRWKPTACAARTHESDSESSFEEESDDEEAVPPVRAENRRPKRSASGKDVNYAGLDES
eukprot:5399075-Prymnesium_polylepis.1